MRIELSDGFINKVKKEIQPHWGELGWVTYKRTYARWIESKQRAEEWDETVKRVVEGNINLDPRLHRDSVPTKVYLELQEEAQKLYKLIYGLSGATSGRNLWISGTDFQKRNGDSLNNCLRGTERVFIKGMGLVPISELKGEYEVLSDGGVYRKAYFKSYGKQKLMRIIFKDGQEVYATPEHNWIVLSNHDGGRKEERVYTKNLKSGDQIPVIRPQVPAHYDEEGLVHGFVYGDGTRIPSGYSRVTFFKDKTYLFDVVSKYGDATTNKEPTITNLPFHYKDLPKIGEYSNEYLLGFILGYISADGYIRGTDIRLHCQDKNVLEYVREIAQYLGLKVNLVRLDRKLSPFTNKPAPLYSLSFSAQTFPGQLLTRPSQKNKFKKAKRIPKFPYKEIKRVEETGLFEEVYCCNEPETHSFVLEGGILTGNCWFVAIRPQKYGNSHIQPFYVDRNKTVPSMPFSFLFDQLMKGGGVGFSVKKTNIDQIPLVTKKTTLYVIVGKENGDYKDAIAAGAVDRDEWYKEHGGIPSKKEVVYETPDSREGWILSNALLIDSHFDVTKDINKVVIDVTNIREKGKRIHGFGGVASGPKPFIEMLFSINNVLNNKFQNKLTSVDCVDICNYIGKTVIAGNVRRSAEIALGDKDDELFITAKQDQEALMDRRWASNNSVFIDQNTQDFSKIARAIGENGEPGIVNIDSLQNYGRYIDGRQEGIDGDVEGTNPCFTGDMRLLTTEGYKRFDELEGTNPLIVNKDGKIVESKVWCSGVKDTVRLHTTLGFQDIVCTPNHRFMTVNGEVVEAKDLKGKDLKQYISDGIGSLTIVCSVIDVTPNGKQKVYDFTEPETHWGVVEGVIVHNCGEISLGNGEPCNLFEVFPLIAEEQGWDLREVFKLAVRFAKRVTFSPYEWQISQDIIRKNRRIGISISGIQDWILKKFDSRTVAKWDKEKPIYNPKIANEFDNFYHYVLEADEEYSRQLHCNQSIKHTTVKPSGTVSKLAGVSEGMHFSFDKYIIQRIRFQDSDPLLPALQEAGYHIEDDVYSANTKVVEFPVKAAGADKDHFVSANDVSIEEQFATQAFLQIYWADNSVSCTITFKKPEADKIEKLLKQYQGIIKSTSLLPYTDSGYQQMPKESITKEKYEEMKKQITGDARQIFLKKNNDKRDLEIVGQTDCEGGACPIK